MCASGLEAVANIASKIKAGVIDCGLAGGVESMSNSEMSGLLDPNHLSENVFNNTDASNCLLPMGLTSENVSKKFF